MHCNAYNTGENFEMFQKLKFFENFWIFCFEPKMFKFSINFQISGFLILVSDSIEYSFEFFLPCYKKCGNVWEIVIFRKILFPILSNFLGALFSDRSHRVVILKRTRRPFAQDQVFLIATSCCRKPWLRISKIETIIFCVVYKYPLPSL